MYIYGQYFMHFTVAIIRAINLKCKIANLIKSKQYQNILLQLLLHSTLLNST